MKTLLILALTIVSVYCESCSVATDCTLTTCSAGSISCSEGTCTCTNVCDPNDDLTRCFTRNQCINAANDGLFSCDCSSNDDLHCIDRYCHCGYPT